MKTNKLKTLIIATGIVFSGSVFATVYEATYVGWATLYDPLGSPVFNPDAAANPIMMGWRTPISGFVSWDDTTNKGIDDIDPFRILGGTMAADRVHADAIGDGFGGAGTLILGNATATWSGPLGTFVGIPLSNVANVKGVFDPLTQGDIQVGDVISTGTISASEDTLFGTALTGFFMLPMGSIPMASTFYNTTPINPPITTGQNPSGSLPLTTDTVPGTPMATLPFTGYSVSFDMTEFTITDIITDNCSVQHPKIRVTLDGSGQSPTINSTLKTTFIGHIKSYRNSSITICPGTLVDYEAVSTVGKAICTVRGFLSPAMGTLEQNHRLVCTNKPSGSDTDRFKIR